MQELEHHSPDTSSIQDELPIGCLESPFPLSLPTSPSTDNGDSTDEDSAWRHGNRDDVEVEALQPSCSVASISSGLCSNMVSSLHATKHVDASRAVRFIRWECSVAFW